MARLGIGALSLTHLRHPSHRSPVREHSGNILRHRLDSRAVWNGSNGHSVHDHEVWRCDLPLHQAEVYETLHEPWDAEEDAEFSSTSVPCEKLVRLQLGSAPSGEKCDATNPSDRDGASSSCRTRPSVRSSSAPMCTSMEVSLGRLEVNAVSSEEPLAHGTEEFMLVLEGAMDIEIGPRRYVLEPGDAIYYHGVTPHRFFSVGDQDLIFVSAVSPPVAGWRPNAGEAS